MRPTPRIIGLATVTLLALSACGDSERLSSDEPVVTNPATPTTPDPDSPVTSPVDDPTTTLPGAFDAEAAARRAASLLGAQEGDLPDDVRVARRGDEDFPLTADLVPGRLTVQLDEDGTGTFVVVEVQIESEDGVQVVSVGSLLDNAASFLGTPEPGLDPSWRIGRRGDETFALTEDFIVGRFTVELDDDGTGAFVVTAVIVELPGGAQVVNVDSLRERASAMIGTAEADLGDQARIARRGEELLPLTMDFRVGRFTYELDDDGTGVFRVVAVQIELPNGTETVTD
jgi:hypothetical protein